MAGPMVGPLLERLELELIETYWTPDGNFPDHEPNPLLPENRQFIIEQGARRAAPTSGSPGTATPTAASSSTTPARSSTATSSRRCSPSRCCARRTPSEAILYDVRASRAVADTVTRAGGTPYVNRVGHAFFKTRMRKEGSLFGGEVSGHYYFRDFYCADSGTIPALLVLELLARERQAHVASCSRPTARATSSPARSTPRSPTPEAKMEEIAARYADAAPGTPRRDLDRLRGLALQRALVEHRAAAAPVPGVARLARGHGAPPRRGARADPLAGDEPLVSDGRAPSEEREPSRSTLALAAAAGIHRLAIPTPFRSGASTPT